MNDRKIKLSYYTWKISVGGFGHTPEEAWLDAKAEFNIDDHDTPPEDSYYTCKEVE